MTSIFDLFRQASFEQNVNAGFVKVQRHPEAPNELAIANYTQKAQINYHWSDVTSQCRGLIYNPTTFEIVARPFAKFFNYDEPSAPTLRKDERVVAFDKVDGSLGIIYPFKGGWRVATRGSFSSDQAVEATKMLDRYLPNIESFDLTVTPLVEIIYPENRIVCDYGDFRRLVYLGEIINSTGSFQYLPQYYPFPQAGVLFEGKFGDLFGMEDREGAEGFVVHSHERDAMVKVKYEEYVALHRIVTRLSKRTVWEQMDGPNPANLQSLVEKIDEEHAKWVWSVAWELMSQYTTMTTYISEVAMREKVKKRERKEVALAIKDEPAWCKAAIFMGLDGRSFSDLLWKNLKPRGDEL